MAQMERWQERFAKAKVVEEMLAKLGFETWTMPGGIYAYGRYQPGEGSYELISDMSGASEPMDMDQPCLFAVYEGDAHEEDFEGHRQVSLDEFPNVTALVRHLEAMA